MVRALYKTPFNGARTIKTPFNGARIIWKRGALCAVLGLGDGAGAAATGRAGEDPKAREGDRGPAEEHPEPEPALQRDHRQGSNPRRFDRTPFNGAPII